MKRQNRKRGFTMAEMLIVVAIIGVLGAVAFIAVNQHQRSLERLERDSVAREIFIAAQNHLTMAESQGYLGLSGTDIYGEVESDPDHIYYFAVNKGSGFDKGTLLDLMLPFGSIDETVRGGGSYIIRYKPKYETATEIMSYGTVLDVFYCSTDDRFGYDLSSTDASGLKALLTNWSGDGKASDRKNFNGKVLGWYGGETAEALSRAEIYAPIIVVENADKLRIGIQEGAGPNKETNPTTSSLQVIIKGVISGAEKVFTLKSDKAFTVDARVINKPSGDIEGVACDYAIILDDITTANMHFADLLADKYGPFIPGEDITIQAVAFDNTLISNIAYSAEITVNSLYEKLEVDTAQKTMTAYINSIRHLENLDKKVSNVKDSRNIGEGATQVTCNLNNAVQTSDMSWKKFKSNTNDDSTVIQLYGTSVGTTVDGCYLPVSPSYALTYEGNYHSVSDIKASYASNAGMFSSITGDTSNPTKIANLSLIDFEIEQTGTGDIHAGALAGSLDKVNVENVVAYNSTSTVETGITAASGNAGGLIGYASDCVVSKSAASLRVKATKGNAGGLIGETSGGEISGCYSGGHTNKGTYYKDDKTEIFNVQATAKNAGGLIGVATSTPIEYSYSTCSVTGAIAGGFVASATGNVSGCYATGLVAGTGKENITTAVNGVSTSKEVTKDGAFAYSMSGTISDCYYFEIINEREDAELGYTYLTALGKEGENPNIKPLDADYVDDLTLNSYNNVNANPANWTDANAYDSKLIEYYGGKYNLRNVVKLGATGVNETETTVGNVTTPADFVATHYGDWPAPEIFVVNTK